MTGAELNRDIKRLWKSLDIRNFKSNDEFYDYTKGRDSVAGKEFIRLYYADQSFKHMNKQSVLILMRINLRFRYEPLHLFGINIEI